MKYLLQVQDDYSLKLS